MEGFAVLGLRVKQVGYSKLSFYEGSGCGRKVEG